MHHLSGKKKAQTIPKHQCKKWESAENNYVEPDFDQK